MFKQQKDVKNFVTAVRNHLHVRVLSDIKI